MSVAQDDSATDASITHVVKSIVAFIMTPLLFWNWWKCCISCLKQGGADAANQNSPVG
jgi:hypothetical protein